MDWRKKKKKWLSLTVSEAMVSAVHRKLAGCSQQLPDTKLSTGYMWPWLQGGY
jgi:hypothetical protein